MNWLLSGFLFGLSSLLSRGVSSSSGSVLALFGLATCMLLLGLLLLLSELLVPAAGAAGAVAVGGAAAAAVCGSAADPGQSLLPHCANKGRFLLFLLLLLPSHLFQSAKGCVGHIPKWILLSRDNAVGIVCYPFGKGSCFQGFWQETFRKIENMCQKPAVMHDTFTC